MNTKGKAAPTDEEIREMMDFDGLMVEYAKSTPAITYKNGWLKWAGLSTVMLVGITITYVSLNKNLNNEIVTQSNQLPTKDIPPSNKTNNAKIDSTVSIQSPKTDILQSIATEKNSITGLIKKELNEEKVNITPEYIAAEPIDGFPALYSYFDSSLKYPQEMAKDSIRGVESVSFIIDKNGRPAKIEIVSSLGKPFDEEVTRLLQNMPSWKPATLNGRPVISKHSIPFTFKVTKTKN